MGYLLVVKIRLKYWFQSLYIISDISSICIINCWLKIEDYILKGILKRKSRKTWFWYSFTGSILSPFFFSSCIFYALKIWILTFPSVGNLVVVLLLLLETQPTSISILSRNLTNNIQYTFHKYFIQIVKFSNWSWRQVTGQQ